MLNYWLSLFVILMDFKIHGQFWLLPVLGSYIYEIYMFVSWWPCQRLLTGTGTGISAKPIFTKKKKIKNKKKESEIKQD